MADTGATIGSAGSSAVVGREHSAESGSEQAVFQSAGVALQPSTIAYPAFLGNSAFTGSAGNLVLAPASSSEAASSGG